MNRFVVLLLACGCGDDAAASPDAAGPSADAPSAADGAPGATPGADTNVVVFDHRAVYFTGSDNQRSVDSDVDFPADGAYARITLHLALACPSGGCDPWDRFGTLGIVTPDGVVELVRFVTPYGVGGAWDYDVTDLRPLLSGRKTLRALIDTWVNPAWSLSVSIEMQGGVPARLPVFATPIWTQHDAVYGDPDQPLAMSVPPKTLDLGDATAFAVRVLVTGHGQGNADNCAEFCSRRHTLTVAGVAHDQTIWRDDCATTAVPGQHGTWQYSRAGWCPGADVRVWTVDVSADLAGAAQGTIAYDVEPYLNTCRPAATQCVGCTLGTGCAYDGGAHTEPHYSLSGLLVGFR